MADKPWAVQVLILSPDGGQETGIQYLYTNETDAYNTYTQIFSLSVSAKVKDNVSTTT